MKKIDRVIIALILFILFASKKMSVLACPVIPEGDIATGPSISSIVGYKDHGAVLSTNYDTSISYGIFSASLNLKHINLQDNDLYGVQSEFTMWFYLNIGGGAGFLSDGSKTKEVFHLFLGLPIPTFGKDKIIDGFSFFIEPYYRLNFYNDMRLHEFGFMVKMTTFHL